jgi:hypothetical protein
VIDAESQTVLNTLTEHDLQDVFTKMAEGLELYVRVKGDYFEGDGGQ